MAKQSESNFIDMIGDLFAKAPALPNNFKETLVKITPIISLIFGILGLLVGIMGLTSLSIFSPFALLGGPDTVRSYGGGMISTLTLIVSSGLLLAAYPGTKARKINGWNMLFWSEVVNIAGSVVSLNILGALVSALIGFYILFQIKSHYK